MAPNVGTCPLLGRGSGTLRDRRSQLHRGRQVAPTSCSVSPRPLNLPSGSLAASGRSFTQCPPLPLVHFPRLKSLFSSLCLLYPRQWTQAGTASPLSPCETCSLAGSLLPLMGDRQREAGEARLTSHRPWSSRLSLTREV